MFSFFIPKPQILKDLNEELDHRSLAISGIIPKWLSGTLVRNGPINFSINGQKNGHWFDGLAMLHAFNFRHGQVLYTNKFLRTDAYKQVELKGNFNYEGFATLFQSSLLKKLMNKINHSPASLLPNANVNVVAINKEPVALTEMPLPVRFNLDTLQTLGSLDFKDDLPHMNCWECAHPHYDRQRRELISYLVEYGSPNYYILYRIKEGSWQRETIAKIPVQQPSYMHSFAVTENYVIFTEFPFVMKDSTPLINRQQSFIHNFLWEPERGTNLLVVDRKKGQVIKRYKAIPFFAFHHINAFESKDQIHLDLICYDDASIIQKLANHYRATSEEENRARPNLVRFSFSLQSEEVKTNILFKRFHEFPCINAAYASQPYNYAYLADGRDAMLINEVRPLYKLDVLTKNYQEWVHEGCYPSEPIFVSSPEAKQEDEGVILSVVLDAKNYCSFLLVLDAKNFQELGRATVPHVIPAGLHGQYFT